MGEACAASWRFFSGGGGGNESAFVRRIAPGGGIAGMGLLLGLTVANLHVLVGAEPGSAVVYVLPGMVAGAAVFGMIWGRVVRRRHPHQLLGRGEPEPLAELPHHLVDVEI